MKKLLFSAAMLSLTAFGAAAQDHAGHNHAAGEDHSGHNHGTTAPAAATPAAAATATVNTASAPIAAVATTLTVDNMAFTEERHAFGTLREGDPAEHVFTFKNTGKEDIIISNVQPACGCTTPDWTRTPIKPGQTGMVKASYGTTGRVGGFDKNLTVMSNAGNKMLYISGLVEKAPETSAPTNNSMIRTN
jgi:hypothetical protein